MSVLMSHVEITFTEEGDRTRAEAVLDQGGEHFYAVGWATRAPGDPNLPIVGEELAAARALSELSHRLIEAAAEHIQSFGIDRLDACLDET